MTILALLPLTLLLWPFNIGFISSQIIGFVLIFITVIPRFNFRNLNNIHLPVSALLFYLSFLFVLIISILFKTGNSEIFKMLTYVLMFPFLFILSFIYLDILKNEYKNNDIIKIFYTVTPFLIFCLVEIIFPNFHSFVSPYVMGDGAKNVYEANAGGNQYRFLGWNGFLFASDSVALAFTALGILIFSSKVSFYSLAIELLCIGLSIIAGRSGLPIVFLYLLLAITYRFNYLRLTLILTSAIALTLFILKTKGTYFFIWMLEPVYRYIEYGSFSSGSVNETGIQYENFYNSIEQLSIEDVAGKGIYFSQNSSYNTLNLVAGDSGFIRLFHSVGFGGLFLLLFWISFLLRFLFSYIKSGIEKPLLIFIIIFIAYGFLFFFKSEWLYQKYFIFIVFYFHHKLFFSSQSSRLEKI